VGSIIAKLAGQYLKPVLLELGGKAPLIVLEDADLEKAAVAAVAGAWAHVRIPSHPLLCLLWRANGSKDRFVCLRRKLLSSSRWRTSLDRSLSRQRGI
jgi:hypothetical protein